VHLPHLTAFDPQPLIFLTACVYNRRSVLANAASHTTLRAIWSRSAAIDGWYVGSYLLMPDHVHLFAQPIREAKSLADWCKAWKSISSRAIAPAQRIEPPVWQAEYFDHFIRSNASYREKWEYVRQNPVRNGLVSGREIWPFQGTIHHLDFRARYPAG